MNPRALEVAITNLLDRCEAKDQSENLYQKWFEEYEFIFELLGYKRILLQPRLTNSSGDVFIPDFMLEKPGGIWHIYEIKRPDTKILKSPSRRQQFYRSFESYVCQCREYSVFFEDEQHRRRFESEYDTIIQHRVRVTLVAGCNDGLDRRRAHDLMFESAGLIDFQTYDDLLDNLDTIRRRLSGEGEDCAGLSVHMVGRLPRVDDGRILWIMDVGEHDDHGRMSVFLDRDGLNVIVHDDAAAVHQMRARADVNKDRTCYLGFELGIDPAFSFGRVWVDDHMETTKWAPFRFNVPDRIPLVFGTDITAAGTSDVRLAEMAVYSRVLKFHERLQFRKYVFSKRPVDWYLFHNQRFMHSQGHPRFLPQIAIVFRGLRINVPKWEPVGPELVQFDPNRTR